MGGRCLGSAPVATGPNLAPPGNRPQCLASIESSTARNSGENVAA